MRQFSSNNLLKWIQEETENLNRPVSIKDTEFLIKNFPIKKTSSAEG